MISDRMSVSRIDLFIRHSSVRFPSVIRVGLRPSQYWQQFHPTRPGQGCFDDEEGDDSVDWVFYEKLYDQLSATLCFDRNRVFAGGNASGARLANELGCKYAGDPQRPIRGVMVKRGELPTDPRFVPTCTRAPMAGMWVNELNDPVSPLMGAIVAMNRALMVNGCTPSGVTFETATFDPFPISATDITSCKRYRGCPDPYPLVICIVPGGNIDHYGLVASAGFPAFMALF
jgi:hypothetical protein